MLNREEPALFVIVRNTPGGDFAVPAASARAAAQVVRHLTEHCPHTQASWQVNPHAPPGPVAVFGGARSSIDAHLRDQDAHVFLLAAVDPLPPVWIALCGHQVAGTEFDTPDPSMGRPCRDCHQRRVAPHRQGTGLPLRVPGKHMHPSSAARPWTTACPEETAAHETAPAITVPVRRAGGSATRGGRVAR